MKNHKLIFLLTLFSGQLLCMKQTAELGKRKKPDAPENSRSKLQSSAAQDAVLNNRDLLENIFLIGGLDPLIVAEVSTHFNLASKILLTQRWNYLKGSENKFINFVIKSTELSLGKTEINYVHFRELYKYLLRLSGQPIPATRPEIDITNLKILLKMFQEAQKFQDENLVKAWPRMRRAIAQTTPVVKATMPAEAGAPEQIRGWLLNEENQAAIQQVTELVIRRKLTYLPEEISLFTALQELHLSDNQLTKVDIPYTLTELQVLDLHGNELKEVTIPATLTALERVYLGKNELTEVTIPNTLAALRRLDLSENQLTAESITIPETIRERARIIGEEDQNFVDLNLKLGM